MDQQFTDAERVEIMGALAELAEEAKPRRFALYGITRTRQLMGWGIEWPEDNMAVFMEPPDSGIHLGSSAEQLRQSFALIGDVRLAWLD